MRCYSQKVFGFKKPFVYFFAILTLAMVGWFLLPKGTRPFSKSKLKLTSAQPKLKRDRLLMSYHREPQTIDKKTATFYEKLSNVGISGPEISELVKISKDEIDFRKVQRGFNFELLFSKEVRPVIGNTSVTESPTRQFLGVYVPVNSVRSVFIKKNNAGSFEVRAVDEDVERRLIAYSGQVDDSLWASATAAEMNPVLVADLAEIFAWQVDFAREVRRGDRWRVLIDQGYVGGQTLNDAKILAAEYVNEGELFQAVYFQKGDQRGYYFPDGSSLRRMFLKSPIKFGRITSRFNRARFHPVLKIRRPHLGVDYGAPIGTPIRAVGDGTISFAARRGGAGNMITLRHNSVYKTNYMHLSRFAKGIRPGAKVKQGDLIGYVGNTGMSTGPHLHFEMWENGRYVDPLNVKFPSAEPLPKAQLAEFRGVAATFLSSLPPWPDHGRADVRGTVLAGEADREIRNIASSFEDSDAR